MSHPLENPMTGGESPLIAPETSIKSPARRQLLAMATALGGAAFAGAIFNPARADLVAAVGKIFYLDPIVLNFALELEELQADFFSRATSASGFGGLDERQKNVFFNIAAQDKVHFEQLSALRTKRGDTATRGTSMASSRRPRTFHYGGLNSTDELLKKALDIKETGLFAYHGAASLLKDNALLLSAVAIAGVEGRHTAALRETMGLDPIPAPFEGALEAQASGRKLARYGFVGGSSL